MKELVFFLEEMSAEAMLRELLPRIIPTADVVPRFITFEGKQDLEAQLVRRMRGYRNPEALFVVMRDQDANPDCKIVKRRLLDLSKKAGRPSVLARIACKELESFYLADLNAVEQGLCLKGIARHQNKYREPDRLVSPKQESPAFAIWYWEFAVSSKARRAATGAGSGPKCPSSGRSSALRRRGPSPDTIPPTATGLPDVPAP
jgi:hypothetical protein